jgi:hypothetical protein
MDSRRSTVPATFAGRVQGMLPALALCAVLLAALALRLNLLVPPERGLQFAADADEGIYAASARLALDGFVPYRDYFCSAPPVALYLYMAVLAPTSQPWGDATGFMALRYASVVYGMVTLLAVYAIGSRLGGRAAGLLAVGLLAFDGWAVVQDRRAMLEAPMNMLSALAVLALIEAERRSTHQHRWYALSGALAALTVLSKTQGLVIVFVLLATLLLQRRWRAMAAMGLTAAGVYLAFSLPYLVQAGDELVRQLLVFQFLRPPNGDPSLMLRVNALRNYPESWLTVRLGLLGLMWSAATLIVARTASEFRALGRVRNSEARWLPVLLWAGLVAASFAVSKTFYLYYYAQLAPPLALLGGSLAGGLALHQRARPAREGDDGDAALPGTMPGLRAAIRFVVVAGVAALIIWRGPQQLNATLQRTQQVKTAYADIANVLHESTPSGATVLSFEPNYAFLGSRPLARLPDGTFFVDTHAHMLYINMDIQQRSWADLLRQVARREVTDEQALLWQSPAQQAVLRAPASYVIIDPRARYLLSPDTLAALQARSTEIARSYDTVLSEVRR